LSPRNFVASNSGTSTIRASGYFETSKLVIAEAGSAESRFASTSPRKNVSAPVPSAHAIPRPVTSRGVIGQAARREKGGGSGSLYGRARHVTEL